MDSKLAKIYYSPGGYWKGIAAIKKLSKAAKVPEETAKKWLVRQAIWQIYLPAPRHILHPKFDVPTPNAIHQADLLFLPHDKLPRGHKVYKNALTVTDVASRYKQADPSPQKILMRLHRPSRRFTSDRLSHGQKCCWLTPGANSWALSQKRWKITKHIFAAGAQKFAATRLSLNVSTTHWLSTCSATSMPLRSTTWVKRLPEVVAALNNEVKSFTSKKPTEAIKQKAVAAKPSTTYSRPVG